MYKLRKIIRITLYTVLTACLTIWGLFFLGFITLVTLARSGLETLPNGFNLDGVIYENYRFYDRGNFRIKDNGKIVVPGLVQDVMWSKDAVYGQRKNLDGSEVYYFYSRKEQVLAEFTNRREFDAHLTKRHIRIYDWGKARTIFSVMKETGDKTYEKPPYTDWLIED